MATAVQPISALVTMEEYLHTVYHPDCEFVDGYLEEKHVGTTRHGFLQLRIGHWFILHEQEWHVTAISELRIKVSPTRVRLPDVSIIPANSSLSDDVRTTPPFIAIEILSPEDRLSRVIPRLKEFLAMGVEHVWLIDPIERAAYVCTPFGLDLIAEDHMTTKNSPIHLDLPFLYNAMDRLFPPTSAV